jgi:uncharacterized damage-inducible protein DinB
MLDREDFARLFDYTVWANHRLMRAAATLSVEDFRRDLGSSHGGVRGTLVHVMGAEWIWLERWKGVSPTRAFDEAEFENVIAVRDRWTVIEEHRASWLAGLRPEAAAAAIQFRTLAGNQEFVTPLWKLVQHLVNHSTYHRGQVVTLLRQLGAPATSTDLLYFDRERDVRTDA